MEFHFPQKYRLGQGVSQNVGLSAKEFGPRTLVLAESSFEGTKELAILSQSLERASVSFIIIAKNSIQKRSAFLHEAQTIAKASKVESLVVLGGVDLLSLGREVVTELAKNAPPIGYIEVPSVACNPIQLRDEAFHFSEHPAEAMFFSFLGKELHRVYLDPHIVTAMTPKTSVTNLLETLFFASEAFFQESAGLTEQSLLIGAIESIWSNLQSIYENPAQVEFRLTAYQAGFNVALALGLLPRGTGLTLSFVVGGIVAMTSSALGSLFLAPFFEYAAVKNTVRLKKIARAFGIFDWEGTDESLGLKIAQDIRKILNTYSLPMRLSDYKIVEAQLNLAVDVVKAQTTVQGGVMDVEQLSEFLKQVL